MTPLVSVLLPTIRPDLFRVRLAEYAALQWPGPCEVVVVSDRVDLDVRAPHPLLTVRLIVQPRAGNIPATNEAFAAARGHYVFATNDEVELAPDLIEALVVAGERAGAQALLSCTQTPYCSNDYYGVFFANCPFGRKTFFEDLNGGDWLFDPIYRCFYGDPDLALRAHARGIVVERVLNARCTHHCVPNAEGHADNAAAYYHRDRHLFVTRWAHLGPPPVDPSLR